MLTIQASGTHQNYPYYVVLYQGHRCRYVGIPETHPLYKKHYSDPIPENLVSIWEKIKQETVGKRGIIEIFLVAVSEDYSNIGLLFDVHGGITFSAHAFKSDYPNHWFFGYDCAHYDDSPSVQTIDYCVTECLFLADQLKEIELFTQKGK